MSGIRRSGRLLVLAGLVAGYATVFGGLAYADDIGGVGGDGEASQVSCQMYGWKVDVNQCVAEDGEDGQDGASYIGGDEYYDSRDEYYDSGDE